MSNTFTKDQKKQIELVIAYSTACLTNVNGHNAESYANLLRISANLISKEKV